jgi:hypothetical protein
MIATAPASHSSSAARLGRGIMIAAMAAFMAVTWCIEPADADGKRVLKGALIGAGVGAVLTGSSRGAALGVIAGGSLGALSKKEKKSKRRW